jgi:histidine ammonia-lyase
VLDLSEQVVAALLIAVHQGVWLRHRQGQVQLTEALAAQVAMLRTVVRPLEEDRALDGELRELLRCIHDESWILYG